MQTRFNFIAAAACALLSGCLAGLAIAQDWGDTPYVQTPMNVVERMQEIAKIGPNDFVVDLGSGDGRMVITAAKKHGARGFGVDLDRRLVALANKNAAKAGVSGRAKFYERDLYATDISEATVLSIYLLPEVNLMARPKLLSTLKPGTRIVSHDYGMGNWKPDYQEELAAPGKTVGIGQRSKILFWVVPGHAAGHWQWRMTPNGAPVDVDLVLQQNFQVLEGKLSSAGRSASIEKGKLAGDNIEVAATLDGTRYELSGRIIANAIEGKARVTAGGSTRELPWSATRVELWDARHASLTSEQSVKELQ
jgi:SAM-dependent methyltransferase